MTTLKTLATHKLVLAGLIAALVSSAGVAYAQRGPRHPNLAAAQQDLEQAWTKLLAAQKANEFDLGGHAQKAKDLIEQARKEVKQAVEAANGR